MRGRSLRPLVHDHTLQLFYPHLIRWQVGSGEGGQMAVTVQRQFESVVTEMYQDAFVGSSIENGATIITFDLRKLDWQRELGTPSKMSEVAPLQRGP